MSYKRYKIYQLLKPKLDKLPCEFTIHDARKVGLTQKDLVELKNRSVLTHKQEYKKSTWKKIDCYK